MMRASESFSLGDTMRGRTAGVRKAIEASRARSARTWVAPAITPSDDGEPSPDPPVEEEEEVNKADEHLYS